MVMITFVNKVIDLEILGPSLPSRSSGPRSWDVESILATQAPGSRITAITVLASV